MVPIYRHVYLVICLLTITYCYPSTELDEIPPEIQSSGEVYSGDGDASGSSGSDHTEKEVQGGNLNMSVYQELRDKLSMLIAQKQSQKKTQNNHIAPPPTPSPASGTLHGFAGTPPDGNVRVPTRTPTPELFPDSVQHPGPDDSTTPPRIPDGVAVDPDFSGHSAVSEAKRSIRKLLSVTTGNTPTTKAPSNSMPPLQMLIQIAKEIMVDLSKNQGSGDMSVAAAADNNTETDMLVMKSGESGDGSGDSSGDSSDNSDKSSDNSSEGSDEADNDGSGSRQTGSVDKLSNEVDRHHDGQDSFVNNRLGPKVNKWGFKKHQMATQDGSGSGQK